MARKNDKIQTIDYENSIKKSNELSMAKLNHGLSLNQMQLLAFAIYSTQNDGKTAFQKYEFENKFEIEQYRTEDAYKDSEKISILQFSTQNLEERKFRFVNVFSSIDYDDGKFVFEWNKKFLPHILELKDHYVLTDLAITAQFKSGFSWTLYEYLKAHYGYWHKEISKEALMKLFGVENRKTYQSSTSQLKRGVLDVAIEELNKYTELEVWYKEERVGRAIVGFVLHWSTGEKVAGATESQMNLLRRIHDTIMKDMMKYMSLKDDKNVVEARNHIVAMNDINIAASKGLTSKQADLHIQNAKYHFSQLERIDANDKGTKVVYYNWLEEDGQELL